MACRWEHLKNISWYVYVLIESLYLGSQLHLNRAPATDREMTVYDPIPFLVCSLFTDYIGRLGKKSGKEILMQIFTESMSRRKTWIESTKLMPRRKRYAWLILHILWFIEGPGRLQKPYWERLLKYGVDSDDKTYDAWKDELGNLLIFVRCYHSYYPL